MSKIQIINYDINTIYKFVKENLYVCQRPFENVENARFHHNINYGQVPSILKHGLLSYCLQKKIIENRALTKAEINHLSDEGHVNGSTCISLSTMDIDMKTISDDEFLYDHSFYTSADILISSDVKAVRNRINYANEFLVDDIIKVDSFKAIDLRLLDQKYIMNDKKQLLIDNYNHLREIAVALTKYQVNIPLRVRGSENFNLDIDKVKQLPELRVK